MLKIEVKAFIGFFPSALYKEHTHPHFAPPLWMDFIYTVCLQSLLLSCVRIHLNGRPTQIKTVGLSYHCYYKKGLECYKDCCLASNVTYHV